MRFLSLFALLALLCQAGAARDWRSVDGSRTFAADYVSSDGIRVTLKRKDGRFITFALEKLHADDQRWIHQQAAASGQTNLPAPPDPKGAAFGNLEFGDTRKEVESKLAKSSLVESALDETLFGRTGLNGVYRTKTDIGGLRCYLFFDWSKGGTLREVSLQTQPVPADRYASLRENWHELIHLLQKLHGNPVQGTPYPDRKDLQDGLILGSHLWRTEEGHSVILGTGQEGQQYNVVVRITSEIINPVRTGEGSGNGTPSAPVFPD